MLEQVEQALDQYARPALRAHCGEVEVTRIEGDTVYIRLLGQCAGCALSYYTVDELLEQTLRKHVPGVGHVKLEDDLPALYQYARELLNDLKNGDDTGGAPGRSSV